MGFSYINHKGKRIMHVDYRECKTSEEMIALLESVAEEYKKWNGYFLTINDFRGTFGSPEFMKRARELGPTVFDAKTKKSTVLGITGPKKILLQAYNAFVKNKLEPFDTLEEALEYLIK